MIQKYRLWLWLPLLVLVGIGFSRLKFDVEVLNLLPDDSRAVQGLKIYQQNFSDARELVLTVSAPTAEAAENTSRLLAEHLRSRTNLISEVTWQQPWIEHPAQAAELVAYLWLNQPPELFAQLTNRLTSTNLDSLLKDAREQLAASMSPADIALLSYDPFGLTKLPANVASAGPHFGEGQDLFASADGTFRIIFVQARNELTTYRDCARWLESVKQTVNETVSPAEQKSGGISIGCTGRPAFVAEIAGGMEHDMTTSVGGTSLIIAALFWLAHRRWKPMLWLLTLLALILVGTLGLGGLIFGSINVVSMGFAAILLGLAVDYAVVHYQEALAHPDLSVPEIRRAIAPSIFWAAVTTITAFLVLNFGGLPGLAQLGSLVAVGVVLSAFVMIFAFLPPLFPDRRKPKPIPAVTAHEPEMPEPPNPVRSKIIFVVTAALVLFSAAALLSGFPKMDATANALRPRHSQAYAALDEIKSHLSQKREPLWLIVTGKSENEIARRLDEVEPVLERAVTNQALTGFHLPTVLWPRFDSQSANRAAARALVSRREEFRNAAVTNGFRQSALGLTESILDTWQRAAATTNIFWPTNELSQWILDKLVARSSTNLFALGYLYPGTNSIVLSGLNSQLPRDGILLSGWELLGGDILASVKRNLWKLVLPMVFLVLLSLWLAFHRFTEVLLSLGILFISGLCLLAVMNLAGWSWNLLNLMALPLILGTGVDYGIFMQLALRRHHGNLNIAHQSVGRALLLCGGAATAGFGSLAFSSNAGMASFGQVCAVGIAGNMLTSVLLLPAWWKILLGEKTRSPKLETRNPKPSSLYRAGFWKLGLWSSRMLPRKFCAALSCFFMNVYWLLAGHRREIVIQNLLPALNNDRAVAKKEAKELFRQFALKLVDLWRYESGLPIENLFGQATGWEHFANAQAQKRGVLLLTPHLGNWEFGGPWLAQKGVPLLVITLAEPGGDFTELRQASRARWNIETLVIGDDPFAFLEIIKRLQAGATVALLVDRPPPASAVTVELFGRPFSASIAAAELARASGCALLPVYLPRVGGVYEAHVLAEIAYDRAALSSRDARRQFTQEIMRAFEPVIHQHLDQWFHFVPIWPK